MFAHFRVLVFGCKFIWLPRCFMLRFEVGPWLFYGTLPCPPPPPARFHFLFADNMFARIAATINCLGQIVGSVAASVKEMGIMQFYLLELNWPTVAIRCDPIPTKKKPFASRLQLNETRWLNCFRLTNWLKFSPFRCCCVNSTQSWVYGQLFMAALIVVVAVRAMLTYTLSRSLFHFVYISLLLAPPGCSLFWSAAINHRLNLI